MGLILLPSVLLPVALGHLPPQVFAGAAMAISLWYLASDRFPLGKRILRLAVVDAQTGAPCTLNQSMTRNLTFGLQGAARALVAFVAGSSWKVFAQSHAGVATALDVAFFGLALYEAAQVDKGRPRLGDRWAGTTIVDLRVRAAGP